ncbi:zinc finger CCCH domain-containing protein 66-like [Nicotiana tabacum]|uniref:Zinc finger CCCH domain-containing protein 66-like n=1 Tax=Nicotiana tabacum TaxID=4097 RepID=A0A1S4BRH0_TOBAC|nr:PREDICTED: zinc finger CCCH domain-containing protein 66-like isoform X1 [Nicotiana tabacum]
MCSGSKSKVCSADLAMEAEIQKQKDLVPAFSLLLELSASDDIVNFQKAVEEEGHDMNEVGLWYGRRIGVKKMGYEERTPLMIAATFGSKRVLNYMLEKGCLDVNQACGSDGATALHCAIAGDSAALLEVVKLLLDASADVNLVDANGKRAVELISAQGCCLNSRRKILEHLLGGSSDDGEASGLIDQIISEQAEEQLLLTPNISKFGSEKKEYPVDPSLPDIKIGIYGTDDFRMYIFKVKPCSRAYSHDWTECPFVHPGENARRRDPRKYHYSCVPCPDFRKGTCQRGDACEYAHGIFECWLHPAQYRTRMCKDETNCNRRVCFFAHKPEELRSLYPSTGSAVLSPRSYSNGPLSLDIASISPLALGSPSIMMPPTSTPPMSPSAGASSVGGSLWPCQSSLATPTLQLPISRLKTTYSARDVELDNGLLGFESHHLRQDQLMDDLSALSSPSGWNSSSAKAAAFAASSSDRNGELGRHGGLKPTNLDDILATLDSKILSQLQGLSLDAGSTQLQSPKGMQMRQNMNQQLMTGYSSGQSSPSFRTSSSFGIDPSGAAAAALSSRSAAFAKRSQSFIDRSAAGRLSGISSSLSNASAVPPNLSGWGSPDGKLDWGIQKEELNKLRKSASFGLRSSGSRFPMSESSILNSSAERDVSWVQSMVKDSPAMSSRQLSREDQQYHLNASRGSETIPTWADQLYLEQEQIVH